MKRMPENKKDNDCFLTFSHKAFYGQDIEAGDHNVTIKKVDDEALLIKRVADEVVRTC